MNLTNLTMMRPETILSVSPDYNGLISFNIVISIILISSLFVDLKKDYEMTLKVLMYLSLMIFNVFIGLVFMFYA